MSLMRKLFRSEKEEVWRRLASELDSRYLEGGLFKGPDAVQVRGDHWIVTLDTYQIENATFTRMRAPFVNPDGLRFTIRRKNVFTPLAKLLGAQDIEVGDDWFDQQFVIASDSPRLVRRLLSSRKIRGLIHAQPKIHLTVKDDAGWFGADFPDGVDELYFESVGVIEELSRLRRLFELFSEVLSVLCHVGGAYEDDVRVLTRRLRGPSGSIGGRLTLWEGDPMRREAAERLGDLADPRALPALMSALDDDDDALCAHAVDALGRIGDPRAVPGLLTLLGRRRPGVGRDVPISEHAVAALRTLGEGELVDAFHAALAGEPAGLKGLGGKRRMAVIESLLDAMDGPGVAVAEHAGVALAALGAVEALPELRARARRIDVRRVREACERVIAELEARAALPRPAGRPELAAETLPRVATGSTDPPDTLPRAGGTKGDGC